VFLTSKPNLGAKLLLYWRLSEVLLCPESYAVA
jgi:hypothetical protein